MITIPPGNTVEKIHKGIDYTSIKLEMYPAVGRKSSKIAFIADGPRNTRVSTIIIPTLLITTKQ